MNHQPTASQLGSVAKLALPCAGSRFRPLVVGYLRVWPTDPQGQADALTDQVRVFAQRAGLTLADVYVDEPASREGAAFSALVEALRRPHINTVVIPSPEHFSRFGGLHRAMCTVIDTETGADILIMSPHDGGAA